MTRVTKIATDKAAEECREETKYGWGSQEVIVQRQTAVEIAKLRAVMEEILDIMRAKE